MTMNNYEKDFVKKICDYESPAKGYEGFFIIDIKDIDKDDPDKKEKLTAYRKYRNATAEIVNALSIAMNSYNVKEREIIDAIKQDPAGYANLQVFCYQWIEMWANAPDWRTDGRNELSTKLCKEIYSCCKDSIPDTRYYADFENATTCFHRTIAQITTNLIVTAVRETNNRIDDYLKTKYGERLRLPMI